MEELKHCPFCGGKAEAQHRYEWGIQSNLHFVSCQQCGVRTRGYYNLMLSFNDMREKAIELWNKRM